MSETPRTDAELPVYHGFPSTVSREFARTLERELSAQEVQMNAVRYRAEKAERELAAAQSELARLAQSNAELRAEVERLRAQIEAMPFNEIAFESPPCYLCGYNGPRYYQPDTHPCAAKYHDPPIDRRALSNEGE